MPSLQKTSPPQDPQDPPVVCPTRRDEVAAAGSEFLGGPIGRRAVLGAGQLTPVRVVALVAIGMFALGMVQKLPCYNWAWFRGSTSQYTHACYSDIPHLFAGRGFAEGLLPYFDRLGGDIPFLEYPVLTGLFMQVAAWLTPGGDLTSQEQSYWLVNAGLLMVCAAVLAVCVARTHRNRPWDGLLVALAPAFALTATINWDLLAVALTAAALLMWSRSRPLGFGILLGLATAAKFYPALLLVPVLLLCWRAGRWRAFGTAVLGAAGAWLVVNLPVMLLANEGWKQFYVFSTERNVDFGSFWLLISQTTGEQIRPETANYWALFLMMLAVAGLTYLALTAPRRPRLAQLAFLIVAAFVLTNKVYSPQYVLWLIPLAALARPRWRDFLVWQACEVMYFLGIWLYLAYTSSGNKQGLPTDGYQFAIVLHLLGTLYLCALVVRDILAPDRDGVRKDGSDDPAGGVLDGAEDVFVLGRAARPARHAAPVVEGPRVEWGVPRE
ncbi:glycosyltransferase family 87 protein [Streptomyces roseicoloratus]|uniref:Glycosyltransferase 87 family protein n=1 Tax=Streptomyces roseicoloratus TaxID=2508722 RepID=A0ABY9RV69_9ACTN|nr:glycosyltransferase 87 family protein [Streptomyces roseicoloratus]WMX46076.1 glycosyltransferase 87 family protein [Streptomyces roseicoloratus]